MNQNREYKGGGLCVSAAGVGARKKYFAGAVSLLKKYSLLRVLRKYL